MAIISSGGEQPSSIGKSNGSSMINGLKNIPSSTNKISKKSDDKDPAQIQDLIGEFGRFQLLIFVFKILIGVTSAFNNLSVTFFAPSDFISFKCVPPASSLSPSSIDNNNITSFMGSLPGPILYDYNSTNNNTHHKHYKNGLNETLVKHYSNENLFTEFLFSSERRKRHQIGFNTDTPKNLIKECNYYSNITNKMEKCKSFKYDTGIWISTVIDEWDLVCDRSWFISVTQSLYMSGFIISFIVFGYLSDRFGRWRALLFGASIECLSGLGCAYAPSVTTFMIFRFLLGVGNAGRSSTSYLVMIEWCGPKWRMYISTLGSAGWTFGYSIMPWITLYYIHFRHMQLFICAYELIFIIWLLFLPESPRWLLTHNKFDKAYHVLLNAAKFNGLIKKDDITTQSSSNKNHHHNQNDIELTSEIPLAIEKPPQSSISDGLKPMTVKQFDNEFKHLVQTIDGKGFTKNENKVNMSEIFKWPNLRKCAIILCTVWCSNSFIYYGIALRVGKYGGRNLFKTFTIAGLTEIPSMAFTIISMSFLPRRTTNLSIFCIVGTLCSLQLTFKYYNYQILQQVVILTAKLFNNCAYTMILYQTMELFPTTIRHNAYSLCSLSGRIGSILAPFVNELAQLTNESIPQLMYIGLSVLTAYIIMKIPETKGMDMPDTLFEAENTVIRLSKQKTLHPFLGLLRRTRKQSDNPTKITAGDMVVKSSSDR